MNYLMLRKLRDELRAKTTRTVDEEAMLKELQSLSKILDTLTHSLAVSSNKCPTCGHLLK